MIWERSVTSPELVAADRETVCARAQAAASARKTTGDTDIEDTSKSNAKQKENKDGEDGEDSEDSEGRAYKDARKRGKGEAKVEKASRGEGKAYRCKWSLHTS